MSARKFYKVGVGERKSKLWSRRLNGVGERRYRIGGASAAGESVKLTMAQRLEGAYWREGI